MGQKLTDSHFGKLESPGEKTKDEIGEEISSTENYQLTYTGAHRPQRPSSGRSQSAPLSAGEISRKTNICDDAPGE